MPDSKNCQDMNQLRHQIDLWANDLGFQQAGITGVDVGEHEQYLHSWLAAGAKIFDLASAVACFNKAIVRVSLQQNIPK